MGIVERVREILERHFPGSVIDVGLFHGAQRVHGHILWAGFEDMEQIDRQQAVHDAIHGDLGPDAKQVSIILTYTPDEFELMRAA